MKSFLKPFDTVILIILNFLFLILLIEMNKPVRVAGIIKEDMKKQLSLV